MNSFLYLFSKFTEEFLLLTAACVFGLLSVYCYEWVIKKRRLGAARDQIPASMVKAYLNQLIAEAQSVRIQLFGLIQSNPEEAASLEHAEKILSSLSQSSAAGAIAAGIPGDLTERLRALQAQLADKESLVVNINIEKTKLLEELETLRRNQAGTLTDSSPGAAETLAKKVKDLESRLEEYSLFEDDLANLKRLQQENIALKKKLEEMGGALASTPETEPQKAKGGVSQDDIDALLEGKPATPPEGESRQAPEMAAVAAAPAESKPEPVPAAAPLLAAVPPVAEPAPEPSAPTPSASADSFENLVSSVEKSLDAPVPAQGPAQPVAASEPATAANLSAKTDDELLKEFENLLNS
jgi:hypothetical protein